MTMVAKKPRVLIIGAGLAGLTAAHRLYTAAGDLLDLSLVEASDRVGGRIHTAELGGTRVELGATWIHGIEGSPIYELAANIHALEPDSLPYERMDGFAKDPITVLEGGLLVDPSVSEPISDLFKRLMDSARSGEASVTKGLSFGTFLGGGLQEYRAKRCSEGSAASGWTLEAMEDALFAMHENTERTTTSADELSGLDVAAEGEYWEFPGDQVTIARGYVRVTDWLAAALPPGLVHLGRRVLRIEWCAAPADDAPVRVLFDDGSIVPVDHVIVTVSLGVLKAGLELQKPMGPASGLLFSPELPEFKRGAIRRLGFGVVGKLFLEIDSDESKQESFPFLQLVFEQGEEPEKRVAKIPWWMRKTDSICPVHGGSRVLLAWLTGKEAMELESLNDEEILRGIHATLEGFSVVAPAGAAHLHLDPRCNRNANRCTRTDCGTVKIARVMKSTWGTDPLFMGAYSYVAVGSSGDDLDFMAEPLPGRCGDVQGENGGSSKPLQILFAGEATHRTQYSTTHGAYYSGVREADRLLQHYGYCTKG